MDLKETLKNRFYKHMERHQNVSWEDVCQLITEDDWKILKNMEETGGEPDILLDRYGNLLFADCCNETPDDRRSVCYDEEARLARKKNAPNKSAKGIVNQIGASLMDEEVYRILQESGSYDEKSQVWIATDKRFRDKGDALFASARHGRTFIYYNGAGSYYRNRGFRCMLKLN